MKDRTRVGPPSSAWSIAFFIGALALVTLPSAHADDQDAIDYRAQIMKTLQEQTSAVGLILSTAIPADNLAVHMETIALTASTALKAFQPQVPGGQAKPKVWSDWADFSKRMNDFVARTAKAAKITKEKGMNPEAILDALECKGCHDVYRDEKK